MIGNEVVNEIASEVKVRGTGSRNAILLFRWFFIVSVMLYYVFVLKYRIPDFAFMETMTLAIIFNTLITVYVLKNRDISKRLLTVASYIDILFVSALSFYLGGINSDIYIFYFFIIGYYGINGSAANALKNCLLCLIFYSVSCISLARWNTEDINYVRLIIKDSLLLFSGYAASIISIEVKRYDELHKKEFRLARMDKLTGLANRHYFDQKIREEIERADCCNEPLNILMFDLDNFKKFNDTYGHVWGDKFLTLFADIIKKCIRNTDIPVRFGGEEFLIIVRELDIIIAKSVADRIRRQLEKQKIYIGEGENRAIATASCGIAQYPRHSKNIKDVIECADRALYYAKENGKNKVVTYDEITGAG